MAVGVYVMAKKSEIARGHTDKTRRRRTAPVQVDSEIARRLTIVAQHRGVFLSDMLRPRLEDWANGLYEQAVQEMQAGLTKQKEEKKQ